MRTNTLVATLAMLFFFLLPSTAQEGKKPFRVNYGIKIGFQGITYNNTDFEIGNYKFNDNTIQSDKVGYQVAPFIRLTKGKFYLQTEAAFGITYQKYDFFKTGTKENTAEYELETHCVKIPLLLGYNFINYQNYNMSFYTGPRAKFIFTSQGEQKFSGFGYDDMYEEIDKTEWYWEFGLGIRIYNVLIDFTYDWGFKSTNSLIYAPADNLIFKSKRSNNVLSFSAGFIF